MKQGFIGIFAGIVVASMIGPKEGTLVSYTIGGALGFMIVSAFTGARTSLWLRLLITLACTWWVFGYMSLSSHYYFDTWDSLTFDDYLQMPWGPAGLTKGKSLEEAKKDESAMRMHRQHYEAYKKDLRKWQGNMRDTISSQDLSVFDVTAAYANRGTALLAQGLSEALQKKSPAVAAWVQTPPDNYDRYANTFLASSRTFQLLRARLLGYMCFFVILLVAWFVLRFYSTERPHSETVMEVLFSRRIWEIGTINMLALLIAAMLPLTIVFIGPLANLFSYTYPFIFGCVLWFSLFKNRELC